MRTETSTRIRLSAKPHGLLRYAFRLPIQLYRLRLGWLLGHRFLLLTHRGRRSGRVYHTALEVIHYDPMTRESIVIAGYGAHADWYRNIQQSQALEIQTGRMRYVPAQRFVAPEEAYSVITNYVHRYGWLARLFLRLLYNDDGSEASRRELVHLLPMVAFRPVS